VEHYLHKEDGLHISPDQFEEVDHLLDWLMEKQDQGWTMVNSNEHLRNLKDRMRGYIHSWDCRAGLNGALIRSDGSLAPCFDLMTLDQDWGTIWNENFDREVLQTVKEKCLPLCSSTCFHTMGYYYQLSSLPQWVVKHMGVG
jgi:MoaA/NifB/PqqE/SkfB family radical SAM enzyme